MCSLRPTQTLCSPNKQIGLHRLQLETRRIEVDGSGHKNCPGNRAGVAVVVAFEPIPIHATQLERLHCVYDCNCSSVTHACSHKTHTHFLPCRFHLIPLFVCIVWRSLSVCFSHSFGSYVITDTCESYGWQRVQCFFCSKSLPLPNPHHTHTHMHCKCLQVHSDVMTSKKMPLAYTFLSRIHVCCVYVRIISLFLNETHQRKVYCHGIS